MTSESKSGRFTRYFLLGKNTNSSPPLCLSQATHEHVAYECGGPRWAMQLAWAKRDEQVFSEPHSNGPSQRFNIHDCCCAMTIRTIVLKQIRI